MTVTPSIDDVYDPELHGEEQAPPAARWQAVLFIILGMAIPFGIWWWAT